MLNGIDPIIIFQFAKLAPFLGETVAKIPLISYAPDLIKMPPIPVYLSQSATGLQILSESKNIVVRTDVDTKTNGEAPDVDQRGIGSTVTVEIQGKKDSVGLSLLSAMMDQIFNKVTSKEYSISYLHGPTTIFNGLLSNYSVEQTAETELLTIRFELTKGDPQPTKPEAQPAVPGFPGAVPIDAA